MTRQPEPSDDEAVRSSYAGFLARVESGEKLEFEEWVKGQTEDAGALRLLHEDCSALEGQLRAIAGDGPADTLFFQPDAGAPAAPEWDPALRPEPSLRIGEYRLIACLGKGGMGEVWEAVHLGLNRRVALKLLDPRRFTERGVTFFDREARAGARVNDPGIVAVHAAGESDGFLWIDQELVEGGRTLADFLREMRARRKLPDDYYHRVARFVADTARSMQVAHDLFVIHRDLKPGNILVDRDDHPKVTDFGLARLTDEQSVSRTGDMVGTYQYMSPEQVSPELGRVDHRTDVFSLGIVLYELLTLERPFLGDTTQELVRHILFERERDACSVRAQVPRDLATICMRALEKVPGDRYASMQALADELERWMGGLPIDARRPGLRSAFTLWRRRHPTVAATLAVLAVAVAVLIPLVVSNLDLREHGETVRMTVREREAENARLEAERREEQYSGALIEMQLAGVRGDLHAVRAELAAAVAIKEDDFRAHLTAALNCMACGDTLGCEENLARACELGFVPEDADADDANEQYALGLYHLLLHEGRADLVTARSAFERCLELDPKAERPKYALYAVCREAGEMAEAAVWLDRYRGQIPRDDTWTAVVEAEQVELTGDNARAIDALQAILADPEVDGELVSAFRVQSMLGRIALAQHELPLAIEATRAALEDNPGDPEAISNLSVAAYLSAPMTAGPERTRWLALARDSASEGLSRAPENYRDAWTLAAVLLAEFEGGLQVGTRVEPSRWEELEGALAGLDVPDAPPRLNVAEIRSEVLYLQAWDAVLGGESEVALGLLEGAVLEWEGNVRAHLFFAQKLFELEGDAVLELVLEQLEEGLDAWVLASEPAPVTAAQPIRTARWESKLEGSFRTWVVFAAAALGDVDRALEEHAAVEELLAEMRCPVQDADLLTYAEGLAKLPAEFPVERARARGVVEQFDLRRAFSGRPEGDRILAAIDAASGD